MARHVLLWVAAVALAIVGVILYARNPEVGTYWLNSLLIAPLFAIVMYTLHRRLPMRLQWVGACLIAPVGGIAYLLWPNDQWWNYGALTVMPLVLLAAAREERVREARGEEPEPRYGALGDGPWGPP